MALEVVGTAPSAWDPLKSVFDCDGQSCRSTSLGSSMSSFAFSRCTETDLGSESVCSFPATMHQTCYGRLHRRASAVNKIKVKVPKLYDSKRVFRCLEQELWPNRKVTNYQLCYGAPRLPNAAWMAPAPRRPRPALPVPCSKGRAVADDSKSDVSPPVSDLGSLPLTDVAASPTVPSATSSRARPRSATPQTRGSSALKSLGARCSEGRPQSALASRCRSSGRSATFTTASSEAATCGTTLLPSAPSTGTTSTSGKEKPPVSPKGLEPAVEGRCPVRNRSRVKHVGCMSWIE